MLGRRFGAYRIERLLGRGGMGAVDPADRADGAFEQHVAIKVIGLPWDSPFCANGCGGSGKSLAQLEHPYIAKLFDGGVTEDGTIYRVEEYIEGPATLDAYRLEKRLGIDDRIRLFAKICEAVQCAHQNLVIHCDLKPGNILVTARVFPKLLDFGTARLLSSEAGVES